MGGGGGGKIVLNARTPFMVSFSLQFQNSVRNLECSVFSNLSMTYITGGRDGESGGRGGGRDSGDRGDRGGFGG